MHLKTEICSLLNIDYPIIQAGMAGGITKPELVAAVSNAGGLGTIGAGYLTPEMARTAIRKVKTLTDKAYSVNIFKVEMADSDERLQDVQEKYKPIYSDLQLTYEIKKETPEDHYKELFQVLIEEEVPVISTTFGLPSAEEVKRAQEKGIKIMTMITSVEEAREAEDAGIDIVIAQGSEAGGHRGTFRLKDGQGSLIGTMALVPQVVDHVSIPVVAAGGIMDGRGLVASLALGAKGIQLGSRFLNVLESGADSAYKEALMNSTEEDTIITKVFSGRPARAIRNGFIEFNLCNEIQPLAYPIQNMVTSPLRNAAKLQGKSDYQSLWSGQGTRLIKMNQKAAEVIQEIMFEANHLLDSVKAEN